MPRLAIALAALAAAGAGGFATAAAGPDPRDDYPEHAAADDPFERTCPTHAEGPEPDDIALPDARRDVVAGRTAIVFARRAGVRISARTRFSRGAVTLKTPIVIRSGAPVTVRIAREDRRVVALDFDPDRPHPRRLRAEHGDDEIVVHPCPPDHPRFTDGKPIGEWTGYPGGLIVERRRCVTIEFSEPAGPVLRRRLALGRRCR